jgi:small-conductance mechanosensitive channel
MQVMAREVQAFGGSEALGLAAIAFAIFIGGFVAVALWQIAGKVTFRLLVSIPWSKWCCCFSCCGFSCCGRRRRRHHKRHHHRHREYREEDELLGEVRPKQAVKHKIPKDRKRHPFHNLFHLIILLVSFLIVISATFWALHVMHTPFSVLASLGIFGYVFGQAAGPIIGNVFCGIILYWTDLVEIGDYIEVPGRGKGVVKDMHTLWVRVDDPNDDHTKDKKIFLNNKDIVYGPLYRYDKWTSLINTKTK